jgi:hypothetical protein
MNKKNTPNKTRNSTSNNVKSSSMREKSNVLKLSIKWTKNPLHEPIDTRQSNKLNSPMSDKSEKEETPTLPYK